MCCYGWKVRNHMCKTNYGTTWKHPRSNLQEFVQYKILGLILLSMCRHKNRAIWFEINGPKNVKNNNNEQNSLIRKKMRQPIT